MAYWKKRGFEAQSQPWAAGGIVNGHTPSAEKGPGLQSALKGVEDSQALSDHMLRCAAAVLDSPQSGRPEVEAVLTKVLSYLSPPVSAQSIQLVTNSPLPGALVRTMRKHNSEAPCVALACVVATRASGIAEGAGAHFRAGALDEVLNLMDLHPNHGGIQNVCLLLLCALLKDGNTIRQAVQADAAQRVLRAMDVSTGREVQYNALSALRLLADTGRHPRAMVQDSVKMPRQPLSESALKAKVAHQSDNAVCNAANDVLALVTPRFKEVLCWHWQSGWCKLGPRCTYAHGPSDLRVAT